MPWRAQIDDRGVITRYKDTDTGEVISAQEYERRIQMPSGHTMIHPGVAPQLTAMPGQYRLPEATGVYPNGGYHLAPAPAVTSYIPPSSAGFVAPLAPSGTSLALPTAGGQPATDPALPLSGFSPSATTPALPAATQGAGITGGGGTGNPLIQPGAQILTPGAGQATTSQLHPVASSPSQPPTAGQQMQGKTLRMEGISGHQTTKSYGYKAHGFLDATSVAILLPTLVLLALIIAAAHKKRLFPWQTIRTFNPPSGLLQPREYERSYLCPPNLRRHGRLGKRNPNATWTEQDGIVIPFGFLARTHLPVTIPLGRLPNKNMFIVAPSGSGKTTLMRAVIKAMMAKPCVIIALEAKANDPNLDEKKEGFKYTLLPEAQQAGFDTLYFNPLDNESIHWNPLDLDPITFASSIVQDVNSLPPEEQHWAERDHGYIAGLATLLKWGAVMVAGEDENGVAAEVQPLPCNPRGLMRLVNNRRNIVESLRRLKSNPSVDPSELHELTQTLSSIIRTDTDWDKNIQGVRGRLRMFKNPNVLRVTERSNIDMRSAMYRPTVLIFGAPASLGPDAESLAACFVYQLQQALHTRYGTTSVLPLFAFFDEYQTLNIDIAGRLSAIVRGANGGLTVILQNISQIAGRVLVPDPTSSGAGELKTIFSNSAIRVCLHNADESTAKFFSDEIGKHAVIVPGISDHYDAKGFGIFPSTWNRIHSQQVVPRVDPDSIKRMEKHHALVYLSPAGDPEFGEIKPLMCDLRGIEEIAKLHLLHNVAGRVVPPPGPGAPSHPTAPAGGISPAAPQPGPLPPFAASGPPAPLPVPTAAAAARSDRLCPSCGQVAGKGRFCIECGKPLPAAPQPAGTVPPFASPAPAPAPNGLPPGVAEFHDAPQAQPPAPVKAVNPQSPAAPARQLPPFARAEAQATVTGRILGATPGGSHESALPAPLNPANAQPAQPPQATPAPSAPAAPGQTRPPVTSLNPDLSRLAVPQAPSSPRHPAERPGQQAGSRSGVEF